MHIAFGLPTTFVVTALHSTDHGTIASTVLVTDKYRRAIAVARRAEKLGYEFHVNDTYVAVAGFAYGMTRHGSDRTPGAPNHGKSFFIRRRVIVPGKRPKWVEEWEPHEP